MFKKNDYILLSIICFFLGIFLVSQFFAAKEVVRVTQPENNAVLALEVSKLTKSNADLRAEVKDLTRNLDTYTSKGASSQSAYAQYLSDSERLDIINGAKETSGQGVVVTVDGVLTTPQIVDMVNAIKNIGAEIIVINGKRLVLNTEMSQFSGLNHYEIKVLGNSQLIKSAMLRKGGIIEQISTKDIHFNIEERTNLEVPTEEAPRLIYSEIIN